MAARLSLLGIILLLFAIQIAGASGLAVFDPANGGHLINMVNQAKAQVEKLKRMNDKLHQMQSMLGSTSVKNPLSASQLLQYLGLNQSAFRQDGLFDKWMKPGAGQAMLGKTPLKPGSKGWIKEQFIQPEKSHLPASALEGMKQNRMDLLKGTVLNSLTLVEKSQKENPRAIKEVTRLGQSGLNSANLHDDLRTTNQLLTLIANEITKQGKLQAQQLALLSSLVAHQLPIKNKTTLSIKEKWKEPLLP